MLLALGLPTQHATRLLGLATPLPVPVKSRRVHHGRHLLIGILRLPLAEFVQPVPQGCYGDIDDLSRDIEQTQRIGLYHIGQADGIT